MVFGSLESLDQVLLKVFNENLMIQQKKKY